MAGPDSDYDGAWKEALKQHFAEFMAKYFPAVAATIDWSHQPTWHDKELSRVLGKRGRRNQVVDVLARVRLLSGQLQWILLHVEVQSAVEAEFALRLARYNCGLTWSFPEPVVTLAILADLHPTWCPQEFSFELGDFLAHWKFPVCKLLHRLETDWRDDRSLPVVLARAQIESLRTASNPEARFRVKWDLVRGLYDCGLTAQQVRELFHLVDWMMQLRPDLETRFVTQLTQFEESRQMPYINSVERLAETRGERKGRLAALRDILAARFGGVPNELQQQLEHAEADQLQGLISLAARAESIAEFSTQAVARLTSAEGAEGGEKSSSETPT